MSRILLAFSTVDGQTRKISERLRARLEAGGDEVTMAEVADAARLDCTAFDRIVLGASIRYGRHSPAVYDFINTHLASLERVPNAFFSVNLVARKPGKDTPEGNPYLRAFRKRTPWQPGITAVFAGKIDYPKYGPLDRLVIRLIMWITHGPTDPQASVEFTNWEAVDAFADRVSRL